ncbi:MAG: hypothetical protein ACLQNE_28530 [Thermoguttaceae bacterium]
MLRTARTIADLDGSQEIRPNHLNEAINYRMLDRNLWTNGQRGRGKAGFPG